MVTLIENAPTPIIYVTATGILNRFSQKKKKKVLVLHAVYKKIGHRLRKPRHGGKEKERRWRELSK